MKNYLLLVFAFVSLSLVFSQESYTVTSDGLNVRNGPGANRYILGQVYKDDIVAVHEITGDWARIRFNNGFGYVNASFLEKQAVQVSSELQEEKKEYNVNQGSADNQDRFNFVLLASFFLIIILMIIQSQTKKKLNWYKNESLRFYNDFTKAYAQANALEQKNNLLNRNNSKLEQRIKELDKYQEIVDAKAEAKKIRDNAQTKLIDSENKVYSAILFYQETRDQARRHANEILKNINEKLPEAFEILKKAEALENTIEGYGNQYVIPGFSVFDELAFEYSFDESGRQLKMAREVTRLIIKQEKAADCEYVERNRRETAVAFVIDAFNGKVDTILASAKTDNAETLIQKINDAYWIVNHLGSPFRNARITENYLDARINELKWLIRVNELIQRRKDEQRELKEEERDAARARKEAEREMLKAQKEIMRLASERDEIILQFKTANDEVRNDLEKKLRELEEKLKEKNIISSRAKSMAELGTTNGTVYIISNRGSFGDNVFKIGLTRRWDPEERVNELFSAGLPFPFDIHALIPSNNAPALERILQSKFAVQRSNKVNTFKEFFNVSCQEIKRAVDELNIEVRWTIAARAQQYEESLKIAKQLEDGTIPMDVYLQKWQKQGSSAKIPNFNVEYDDNEEAGGNPSGFDTRNIETYQYAGNKKLVIDGIEIYRSYTTADKQEIREPETEATFARMMTISLETQSNSTPEEKKIFIDSQVQLQIDECTQKSPPGPTYGGYTFSLAQMETVEGLSENKRIKIGEIMVEDLAQHKRSYQIKQDLFSAIPNWDAEFFVKLARATSYLEEKYIMLSFYHEHYYEDEFKTEEEAFEFFNDNEYLNNYPQLKAEIVKDLVWETSNDMEDSE